MQNVGIIGLGNTGGQNADMAQVSRNIHSIAINSSNDDLRTLNNVEVLNIGDGKGAGQDRALAKSFMKRDVEDVIGSKEMAGLFAVANTIFIICSTDGGTGSGTAPSMARALSRYMPNKNFIVVGVLPPIDSGLSALQNSIEFLRELKENELTYMLYDNGKYLKTDSTAIAYRKTNQDIINDICILRGDYQHETTFNSIDEQDATRITSTVGRLAVLSTSHFLEKDMDELTLEDLLLRSQAQHSVAEFDRDKIIRRLGMVFNFRHDHQLPTTTNRLKDVFGVPVENFQHYHVIDEGVDNTFAAAIMAGLSLPEDWIMKAEQAIDEVRQAALRRKENYRIDDIDTSDLADMRNEKRVAEQTPLNKLSDLF